MQRPYLRAENSRDREGAQHPTGGLPSTISTGTLCSTNIVHTYAFYARNQTDRRGLLAQKRHSTFASVPFLFWRQMPTRGKLFNEFFLSALPR